MPKLMNRSDVCSAATLVTIGGEVKPAREWAVFLGINWQTVKMRRYRGTGWDEVFQPRRRGRKPFKHCSLCEQAIANGA